MWPNSETCAYTLCLESCSGYSLTPFMGILGQHNSVNFESQTCNVSRRLHLLRQMWCGMWPNSETCAYTLCLESCSGYSLTPFMGILGQHNSVNFESQTCNVSRRLHLLRQMCLVRMRQQFQWYKIPSRHDCWRKIWELTSWHSGSSKLSCKHELKAWASHFRYYHPWLQMLYSLVQVIT